MVSYLGYYLVGDSLTIISFVFPLHQCCWFKLGLCCPQCSWPFSVWFIQFGSLLDTERSGKFIAYLHSPIINFLKYDIQLQYYEIHPMGVIPVQTNDVVFSVHATVFSILTAIQCIVYEVSIDLLYLITLIIISFL